MNLQHVHRTAFRLLALLAAAVTGLTACGASKVISVTEREGLHTLDAIVLPDDAPEIHTADTHGATELVFAAFDLLGRRFIPRLNDIADVALTASALANLALPPTRCSHASCTTR